MLPKRPHVALVKGLVGVWVIGATFPKAVLFAGQFLYSIQQHLGESNGTGGVFDAIRMGVKGAMPSPTDSWAWHVLSLVALIAAIVFLRTPVPKILRATFVGDES